MVLDPWSNCSTISDSLLAQIDPAALEGLIRMTDIRVKIGEPQDSALDTDNLDGFIQDMAKKLGTVVKEHWMSYVGEAKALYNDIEQMVDIRAKLQQTSFPFLPLVDEIITAMTANLGMAQSA